MSHDENCDELGFGVGAFGEDPFGGGVGPLSGALPVTGLFDIYCLGPCGPMAYVSSYSEVTLDGPAQFIPDGFTSSLIIGSGGVFAPDDARLTIDVPVPQAFTWELNVLFRDLPSNFTDLTNRHIYFGGFDSAGNAVGLFVSAIGLLYAGAVHHTAGNLILDSATQALPNSDLLVEKDVFITIRLVTSYDTGTTFIYWTRHDEVATLGHQLRYVLPGIKSSTSPQVPADSTLISVRGTPAEQVMLAIDSMCLGTGLLIPNIAPIADAGVDQAVRTCAIVQLDGTKSFDPEGAGVSYKWRLIDTPLGSQYIYDGVDGRTYPLMVPTGFTTKFHSIDLNNLEADDPLLPGDVVLLGNVPYTTTGKGSDVNGFYVLLASEAPDSFATSTAFKYIRQRGISNPATAKPTFLPDKPGLYKFDLTVNDGALDSLTSTTVVNVTESPVPRGIIPDLRFLWGYLSDFWNLIEEKERVEVYWSGLAQIAAAEMLNLWQLDYSKSLRDVQRTFERKWLRYDMLMEEDSFNIERTVVQTKYQGFLSTPLSVVPASRLDIEINGTAFQIYVPGTASLNTAALLAAQLQPHLDLVDPRLQVSVVAGGADYVRLNAPFAFKVLPTSTCTFFPFESNTYPQGLGTVLGTRTYRVDTSLEGMGIEEGDLLVLNSTAYRIARVNTDTTDTFGSQRVTLVDPLPDSGDLLNWSIGGTVTSKTLDFWNGMVTADDHVFIDVVNLETGETISVQTVALGANEQLPGRMAIDASSVGSYLLDTNFSVLFRAVLRRHYLPIDRLVQDVPYLQEKINNKDDKEVLRRNVDFFIEAFRNSKVFRFIVGTPDVWQGELPPKRLWAETTYLDNRPLIEANFGLPAAFTLDDLAQLPSNIDYLSAVRGLWFSYFKGPTLFNLRAGVQILLGLPFAEEEGVIVEIRDDFSSKSARILVRDTKNTEVVRSYTYPAVLDVEKNPDTGVLYAVGDTVKQFAPLVEGSEIVDWVKDPKWIEGYINQGTSFEVEKFFRFLVRVDADAFNLSSLLFAQSFVRRIKPTYTHPMFVVQRTVQETEVSVSDDVEVSGTLTLYAGTYFGLTGQAQMWDQPRPGGGGYWNHFDQADPNAAAPTYGTATSPIMWGMDQNELTPAQMPMALLKKTLLAPALPTADSIFYADTPVFVKPAFFMSESLRWITTAGVQVGRTLTPNFGASITSVQLYFRGVGPASPSAFRLTVKKNGANAATFDFVVPPEASNPDANVFHFNLTTVITTSASDTFEVWVSLPAFDFNTFVEYVAVVLGVGTAWQADVSLPAATYQTVLPL